MQVADKLYSLMKSIKAVFLGMLLALLIGVLTISGVIGPLFTNLLGEGLSRQMAFPASIFTFMFAFYFGGMLASYRAPSYRILHGTMVSIASFAVSVMVNLSTAAFIATARDPLANFRTPHELLLTVTLLVVSIVASYVGGRRGAALYLYNSKFFKQRKV